MYVCMYVCRYVREQGCEDTWLFFEAKGVRGQKSLGNTSLRQSGEEQKIMQLPTISSLLGPQYFPQHPVPEHTQCTFFLHVRDQVSQSYITTHFNTRPHLHISTSI